jgi:hypothetical protein
VLALAVACQGQGSPRPPDESSPASGLRLVSPEPGLEEQCRQVAHQVGYPVACPNLIPQGSFPAQIPGSPQQAKRTKLVRRGVGWFRHWVFLDLSFPLDDNLELRAPSGEGYLVISSAPEIVGALKFVCGPERGKVIGAGSDSVRGIEAQWVRAPASNCNSIFTDHLVLVWSTEGHTYGVGFHGWGEASRKQGLAVARSIRLVPPS